MEISKKVFAVAVGTVAVILLLIVGIHRFKKHTAQAPAEPPLTVVGVGLLVGKNEEGGKYYVRKVFPASPAEKAGIVPGVILNKIDNALVETNNVKQLASLLIGRIGTKVQLEIINANGDTAELEVIRQPFVNRSKKQVENH
jgi:C-terminal processing protease CtpA/Prc